MFKLFKIVLLTLSICSLNVLGNDLSNLKGKWVGTTQLSDIDHLSVLKIEDDSSGYYIQTILASGVRAKYTFTVEDLTIHEGYYELLLHRKNKPNIEKLIFTTDGYQIKGMNISIIKAQTVLHYNLNLLRYSPIKKAQ